MFWYWYWVKQRSERAAPGPPLFRLGLWLALGGMILGLPVMALWIGSPATMFIGFAVAVTGLAVMITAVIRKYRGRNG